MALYVKCNSCKEEFRLKHNFTARPDLIAELGEYFKLQCSDCASTSEYHANDVFAKSSFSTNIIGTTIGVLVIVFTTLIAWNMGFITTLGLILGGVLLPQAI